MREGILFGLGAVGVVDDKSTDEAALDGRVGQQLDLIGVIGVELQSLYSVLQKTIHSVHLSQEL